MSASATATTRDRHHPERPPADPIAVEIASGKDLGVFELAAAVAKARTAIPPGSCPRTDAAAQAAIGVRAAFDKVATAIYSLDIPEAVCPCCDLGRQLDELIFDVARPGLSGAIAEACEDLADYAGDDFPDNDATRRVLELARDVFVAAVADRCREEQ
jgi:hypothetical protein